MTPENQEKLDAAMSAAWEKCTPEWREAVILDEELRREINNAVVIGMMKSLESDAEKHTKKRHLKLIK